LKTYTNSESVRLEDGMVVLKCDQKLNSKQINYFTLYDTSKKQHRYIFDIHASMLSKSQNLRKDGIKRIKLAQYNSNTLRLVIANSKKLKVSFKKELSQLIINIQTTSKKSLYTKNIDKVTSPLRVDRNKVIVIDAGHGGRDPGAVGYRKYREKIVVLQIANEVKKILKSRGYRVYMSRSSDKFVKLSNRTEYANKKNADIFVSIHANSVPKRNAKKAHGIECYFLAKSRSSRATSVAAKENSADMSDMNRYGKESFLNFLNHYKILASNKLAIDLQRGMLGSLNRNYKNVKDGGVREGPFWVLVGAQMPAVLVEVGFISHPAEAKRLVNRKYQQRLAMGLADGIERYFANN
ncbi:MAG: N-acetylmuramoyl-L-alanine amidase, partial [Sulfurimonas sp.]|nr:N-acetylmuramoyl-L-alanine amidase [Sulfurimonas sp.]